MVAKNLTKLKSMLFGDLIKLFISVFGQTSDTYKLCKYVFDGITDNTLKNEAMSVLEQAEDNEDFDTKNV